ncbi:hypothetical protein [Vandammella animalimorsus]|uniref:hypothetical protein n=1 Tax=Vandammella animalimorsus TaxID=2029117 RepID=UPI001553C58F|nr:hypothetical protein [Vandammella animalimorsus]
MKTREELIYTSSNLVILIRICVPSKAAFIPAAGVFYVAQLIHRRGELPAFRQQAID